MSTADAAGGAAAVPAKVRGSRAALAGVDPLTVERQFHCTDFEQAELAAEGLAFEAKAAGWVAARLSGGTDTAALPPPDSAADQHSQQQAHWEAFHAELNKTGSFFKPRHFTLEAFKVLREISGPVLEVGCGNGSNIAPLLGQDPSRRLYASDFSRAALGIVANSAELRGRPEWRKRLSLFEWDVVTGTTPAVAPACKEGGDDAGTAPGGKLTTRQARKLRKATAATAVGGDGSDPRGCTPAAPAEGGDEGEARVATPPLPVLDAPPPELDAATPCFSTESTFPGPCGATLCMFVLSAVPPALHARATSTLAATLAPGGCLCFRDYGRWDLAQLRAGPKNVLSPSWHQRGDGTYSYYFTPEEVQGLLQAAGLEVIEAAYHTVELVNRAKGITMRRVFVHALARKPASN